MAYYSPEEAKLIETGTYTFIENYLGEIKSMVQLDEVRFEHNIDKSIELNPIEKLESYINWREKEFIEKYDGFVFDTDNSDYASMEWTEDGNDIIGICNTELIRWDAKASHPWIIVITIEFDAEVKLGMPEDDLLEKMYDFEENLRNRLKDKDGYLQVAQNTGAGKREIYFANKEYEQPIRVLDEIKSEIDFEFDYEIFRDKYWRSMRHFEH